MCSRNINDKSIENYASRYIGSAKEIEDVKEAYKKFQGRIKDILQCIPYTDTNDGKKRITDMIETMKLRGELEIFPCNSATRVVKKTESGGRLSVFASFANPGIIVNMPQTGPLRPAFPCSTPVSITGSNNTIEEQSRISYVGHYDILKISSARYTQPINDNASFPDTDVDQSMVNQPHQELMKQQYFNQQCPSFSPTNIGLDDETIPFGSLDLVNHARMDEMRLLNFIGAGLTQPSFDRISINERSLQNNNIKVVILLDGVYVTNPSESICS